VVRIQAAFEQAGIQFIEDDETGGFGLRMSKALLRCYGIVGTLLSDNVRQVECWFSQPNLAPLLAPQYGIATMREDHCLPRSGRAVRLRRWTENRAGGWRAG